MEERPSEREEAAGPQKSRWNARRLLLLAIPVLLVLDAVAFVVVPPFPPGEPGAVCQFPVCFINGNFEFPAPTTVFGTAPEPGQLVTFTVGISSTLFTMWIVGGALLIVAFLLGRLRSEVPGRIQNMSEWAYESIANFGMSIGGPQAAPYIPIFAAFFLLILLSNWAGLVPPIGKLEFLRAPTSDLNVTLGLALTSWFIFQGEGFRKLGVRGYLGKFFPLYEFKKGVGAGFIAMFVGLIELMLEFVKPITLSFRLFGNIYAGEVAIGVISALTIAVVPVALLLLEGMLNLIQAVIFSVLSLVFILIAVESHHDEEGHMADDVVHELKGDSAPSPAH
ncbi:MAG: F0F1 ATP synthase subunit A [Chloroflexota bacterium]